MEIVIIWLFVFVIRLVLIQLGWNHCVVDVCPGVKEMTLTHAFFINILFASLSFSWGGSD